ncbi:MAG: HD family hydrolase [Candidatus Nanoarchaeia archaeon]
MKDIVNFLFEVGILSKTPRSGFYMLGSGNQSVAEHTNRVCFIGYALASLEKGVDILKVMKMCLLHDLAEGRVSDLNYIHQKYAHAKEKEAIKDLAKTLPFGEDMENIINEYLERKSKEAIITKDADNLEWILSLKEQLDNGNTKAHDWIIPVIKRLKTTVAKQLAEDILISHSDDWWFKDKEGNWWVSKNKEENKDFNQTLP